MAPKKAEPGTRPNRVRFVLLEADLSDNNFSELAQAITQALRTTAAPGPRTLPSTTRLPPTLNANPPDQNEVDEITDPEEPDLETEIAEDAPKAKQPRGKQKYTVPDFKHDLDMVGSSISFKDFAHQHSPRSNARRYLVAAMWMKEHGNKPTISIHGNVQLLQDCWLATCNQRLGPDVPHPSSQ